MIHSHENDTTRKELRPLFECTLLLSYSQSHSECHSMICYKERDMIPHQQNHQPQPLVIGSSTSQSGAYIHTTRQRQDIMMCLFFLWWSSGITTQSWASRGALWNQRRRRRRRVKTFTNHSASQHPFKSKAAPHNRKRTFLFVRTLRYE